MQKSLMNKLVCINCNSENLVLKIEGNSGDKIYKGSISCPNCSQKYVIDNGILRIIKNEDDDAHLWNSVWEDVGFEKSKDKIEHILKNKEATVTMYPHLGIIKKLNTKYNDVLDIGCGSGSFSITFKKIFGIPNFFLVDNSLSALFLGKKIFEYFGEECELIQCDARKLPFKEKSFDLVYSTGLLEHFDKSDQERIVNENCRVSRDIICQVPTNSVPYWMMRFFITIVNRKWPFGNEIPLSMDDLEQLFTKNNYTINYVSYHDLLTSMFFLLSSKTKFIKPLEKKTFLNRFLKHEIAIYAIETNKDGLHSTN